MIIKNKDDNSQQVDYLSELLERDISDEKKRLIDRELKAILSGAKGEKSSAYYLDFEFKPNKDWVLIHDLRLEHESHVAQIDHLLIGRSLDIYVLETKNFASGVSISAEGEFAYFYNNKPFQMPSPIEQNERHITLLKRLLDDVGILPTRMGMKVQPRYKNIVLISPTARLTKPNRGGFDSSMVMKSDMFVKRFKENANQENVPGFLSFGKSVVPEALYSFAKKLADMHKPHTIDYQKKFRLDNSDSVIKEDTAQYNSEIPNCPKCGKQMELRTSKKGKTAGAEFWGCSDYPKCTGNMPVTNSILTKSDSFKENTPVCPKCQSSMVRRKAEKGKLAGKDFWGCSKFPACKATLDIDKKPDYSGESEDVTTVCPECNKPMIVREVKKGKRSGKKFWGCSDFPKCKGTSEYE